MVEVYKVPTSNPLITTSLNCTKQYASRAKDLPKADKKNILSEPYLHVWNTVLKVFHEEGKRQPKYQALAGHINEYVNKYAPTDPNNLDCPQVKSMLKQVKYCRVQKCYDQSFKRLEVSIVPNSDSATIWQMVLPMLLEMPNVEEMSPMAPPGNLERQIQQWLDES